MHSTQIGVHLTLTVVTRNDTGSRIDTAHLADLTPILFWLLTAIEQIDRLTTRAARCAARVVFSVETWLNEPVHISLWYQYSLVKNLAKNLVKNLAKNLQALISRLFDAKMSLSEVFGQGRKQR